MPSKPLVDKEFQLQRMPGKGGWTYAEIPEIPKDKRGPFGFVRVKGTIDAYVFKNFNLMPMGNGHLFMPVKAAVRKEIKKAAGDFVRLRLWIDNEPTEIPEELMLCLLDEPNALATFQSYTNGEQKAFIDWIYSAKTLDTRAKRIAITLDKINRGEKYYNTVKKSSRV